MRKERVSSSPNVVLQAPVSPVPVAMPSRVTLPTYSQDFRLTKVLLSKPGCCYDRESLSKDSENGLKVDNREVQRVSTRDR